MFTPNCYSCLPGIPTPLAPTRLKLNNFKAPKRREKLADLLCKIFQLNQPELDFGKEWTGKAFLSAAPAVYFKVLEGGSTSPIKWLAYKIAAFGYCKARHHTPNDYLANTIQLIDLGA